MLLSPQYLENVSQTYRLLINKHKCFDYFNFCLAWSKFHSVSVGENKMFESGRSSFRSLAETGFEISGKGYSPFVKFKSPQIYTL